MNEDSFIQSEIEALRSQQGDQHAMERVVRALQKPRKVRIRTYRLSLVATAVAALAIGVVFFVPSRAAASLSRVVRALEQVKKYHIRSIVAVDGKNPRLMGETWVDEGTHRTTMYLDDGSVAPKRTLKSLRQSVMSEQATAYGVSLDDQLWNEPAHDAVEYSIFKSSVAEFIKGKEPSATIYGLVHPGRDGRPPFILASCFSSVRILKLFLEDGEDWTLAPAVQFEGRTLDRYTLKKSSGYCAIYVDRATNLPAVLKLQFATDYYDYEKS